MTETTYTVTGMTCGCCASKVRAKVGEVDGVQSVEVDEAAGKVVVASGQPLDVERVRAAVADAGFELVA